MMSRKKVKDPWGEVYARISPPDESAKLIEAAKDWIAPRYVPEKGWMHIITPVTEQEAREWFLDRGLEFDPEPEKRYLWLPPNDEDDEEEEEDEDNS